jgi:hypothetical protein
VKAEDVNMSIDEATDLEDNSSMENPFLWRIKFDVENVFCEASDVDWSYKQLTFPYLKSSGIADTKLRNGSIHLQFLLETSEILKLSLVSISVSIPTLRIHTKGTPLASLYNTILTIASKTMQEYAEKAIYERLSTKCERWLNGVNELLTNLDGRYLPNSDISDLQLPPAFIPLEEESPPSTLPTSQHTPALSSSSSSSHTFSLNTAHKNEIHSTSTVPISVDSTNRPSTALLSTSQSTTAFNSDSNHNHNQTTTTLITESFTMPYDITLGF